MRGIAPDDGRLVANFPVFSDPVEVVDHGGDRTVHQILVGFRGAGDYRVFLIKAEGAWPDMLWLNNTGVLSVMAYVVWKLVRGQGPYAYLRESVRLDGKVRARHLGYLGRLGSGDEPGEKTIVPGSVVCAPTGQEIVVLEPPAALMSRLGTTRAEPLPTTPAGVSGTTDQVVLGTAPPKASQGGSGTERVAESGATPSSPLDTTESGGLGTTVEKGEELSHSPPVDVRPQRLPDGTWGVWCPAGVSVGDMVQVVTASGKTWETRVVELVSRTNGGTVARTEGRPQRQRS